MRAYLDQALAQERGWAGLPVDALAFLIARFDAAGRYLIVVDEEDRAEQLVRALRFFHPQPKQVREFPADDGRPYDGFSADRHRVQRRLRTLYFVDRGGPLVVVASVNAMLQRVCTAEVRRRGTTVLRVGQEVDRDTFVRGLVETGYLSTEVAEISGSFALRGDVIDVWPAGSPRPVRLDFFDEELESIRKLDPASLHPVGHRQAVLLHPAREERLDADSLAMVKEVLGQRVSDTNSGLQIRRRVIEDVRAGVRFSGIEAYLPALVETITPTQLFADFTTTVLEPGDILAASREFLRSASQRWELLDSEERPLIPPHQRYGQTEELDGLIQKSRSVWLVAADGAAQFSISSSESFAVHGAEFGPTATRLQRLIDADHRVALVVETEARRTALGQLLEPHGLRPTAAGSPLEIRRGKLSTLVGDLPRGFVAEESGWVFIPAAVLFGGFNRARRERLERIHQLFESEVTDLSQLKRGDLIVHRTHGVGRYMELKRLPINGVVQDFVRLEYRGGDTMFLPVTRLKLLSRYTPASSSAEVKLDRLGGQTWTRRKGKVRDNLLKMAHELLKLHAKREIATRVPLDPPGPVYQQFVARFPFEETVDQLAAIDAVAADFSQPFPMDRLLVGDVGFGKTEVALRAAMRMIENGKQVAVLCPTTVLAFQHYNTWRERFKDLGVEIRMLSRFTSEAEQRVAREEIAAGTVQVVIGTTTLLGRTVRYENLGLVVIDEEHRFGVRQKSRLKKLRTTVDILSMSATPIPRTLQLALGGLREMSIMATPPVDRLAVATSIARLSESRVRDAVLTEIERGGQVFVIHNRIETINRFADQLRSWVPQARFEVAHGKLPDTELEDVLVRFIDRKADVLVCTAIVETGVDLPNVNTMLIHRADMFGLAQLYQLRGRVGRSHVRARCLLLTPEDMTPQAKKRTQVLVENTELGAGFKIASADLELRGGGNLLGAAQSGQIDKVGYDVWVKLLEEAVAIARGEHAREHVEPELEIPVDSFIPESLIPDVQARLGWYGRLSNATTTEEVDAVVEELEGFVGDLPEEVRNLAGVSQTMLRCRRLGISRLSWLKIRVVLEFHPSSKLQRANIEQVLVKHPKRFSIVKEEPLRIAIRFTPREEDRPFVLLQWILVQLAQSL